MNEKEEDSLEGKVLNRKYESSNMQGLDEVLRGV